MKVAVTGYKGYVGSELIRRGYIPLNCDITDLDEIEDEVKRVNPEIIVHCASLTDVDRCEKNPVEAFEVNVRGTSNVLKFFKGKFIYLSTDHVFRGRKWFAYSERHEPSPVNVYGLSKYAGEVMATMRAYPTIVIRTSKLFDYSTLQADLEVLQNGMPLEFTDLIKRSFLHLEHFVDGLEYVIQNFDKMPPILHISSTEVMSYAHFWKVVANIFGLNEDLVVARKTEIEASPRPFRAGLNVSLAKGNGVPIFSTFQGIEKIKSQLSA